MSTADADLFHGRGIRAKAVGHDALGAAIFLHDAALLGLPISSDGEP
jgi:hypothetical protein